MLRKLNPYYPMSDQTLETKTAEAQTAEAQPPELDVTSNEHYTGLLSKLPAEIRDAQIVKESKSLQSLVEQAVNGQALLSKKRLPAPEKDWTEKQQRDWHEKSLSLPKEAKEYEMPSDFEFKKEGQDAPVKHSLDKDTKAELEELAHALKLTKWQANDLARLSAEKQQALAAEQEVAQTTALKEGLAPLQEEWGSAFNANRAEASEAYEAMLTEIPELEALAEIPEVANNPAILKLFYRLSPLLADHSIGGLGSAKHGGSVSGVVGLKSRLAEIESDPLFLKGSVGLSYVDMEKQKNLRSERLQIFEKLSKVS